MDAQRLLTCIREDRAPHAILIAGPEGTGRAALARRAAAVYCLGADAPERLLNCPHYAELSGESVGVEEVRTLMAATAMQGFNGQKRAFVLTDAHRMNPQSQNALLKTLEEPPRDTLLVLSGNEDGLLPTVCSRCMIFRLGAQPVAAVERMLLDEGVAPETAALAAAVSDGVPGRARLYAGEQYSEFRKSAVELFGQALFSASPFSETLELVTVAGGEPEPEETGDGKRKRGKKADVTAARMLIESWESLARDALLARLSAAGRRNPDARALTDRIAARFTTAQIQSIIEMLGTAQKQLALKIGPRLVIDTVLAGLYEKEIAGI